MKKIFLSLTIIGSIAALTSCNSGDAEKLKAEDATKVTTAVDEKFAALQAEVTAECDSKVLAAATTISDSLTAAAAKATGKKAPVAAKPKPKPAPAPAPAPAPEKPTGFKGSTDKSQETSGGFKSSTDKSKEESPKKGFKGSADQKK